MVPMSVESLKELEDFFRSMRQAFNSRDLKTFRSHFWTDKRFQNLDASGRRDRGWGAFEEVLDQEFRYLESVKLDLRDLDIQVFEDQFATAAGTWKLLQNATRVPSRVTESGDTTTEGMSLRLGSSIS